MTKDNGNKDIVLSLGVVAIIALMVLPLPPFILDLLLATSFAISLTMFLVALQVEKPLDFSSFPSLLLLSTLFRLSLNVAMTRTIISRGHEGEAAAGAVVKAFAEVLLGGNYVVGIVTFAILVTINFVVITKGAGRVAEVSARFTLDALPGKQMSIDAELNAGHINEKQARDRRKALEKETDFYGAMDGASKFVRGDAIAAIVIIFVDVIGGLLVGVFQQGMDIGRAAQVYTVLSVGDGLVSQLPALLVSTAAGILSTRSGSGSSLSGTLKLEMLGSARPLQLGSTILTVLGLVPGMPHLSYLALAGGMFLLSRSAKNAAAAIEPNAVGAALGTQAPKPKSDRSEAEDALSVPLLELEFGYELVPLVDKSKGGELLTKLQGLRKHFAEELGVIVPAINLRDNLRLQPGEYRLLLSGNELGRGSLRASRLMAMAASQGLSDIAGEPTKEPAFGLEAKWIAVGDKDTAEMLGYTVVDPQTVAATHLSELVRKNAAELLGRKEAQHLFDLFAQNNGKLVEDLMPGLLPASEVIKVLRNLLREGQSIRDLRTIFEALLDCATQTKDPEQLTELVRQRLCRHITARFAGSDGKLHALFLDPRVEDMFRQMLRGIAPASGDATELSRTLTALEQAVKQIGQTQYLPLLVVSPEIRRSVMTVVSRYLPGMAVISHREVDSQTTIASLGVVSFEGAQAPRLASGAALALQAS